MTVWQLGQKPQWYHWCQPEGLERCFQTSPHLSFTSGFHQQPSLSETTLFLASVRDLFASRNLKVILKDKVKIFSAATYCQFMLSTNCRPQNSGWIQGGKVKERGEKNVLATIQSPMELEETLSYESFKNKISLDTALENVPWGTGLYWRGNEQDELIL